MSGGIAITTDARGIARLTLDRPEKRNALDAACCDALASAARDLATDAAVRVVVLEGAGSVFCAGGDLDWMRAQAGADRTTRLREARRLAEMLRALNELPKPLIARIHGAALGGGVGLVCVSDVAIASEDTAFGLTETRLGLIPATISPYVLARMGEAAARAVMLSGRRFDAAEAVRFGLVTRAVPMGALDAAVEAEVEANLLAAPGAQEAAKRLARSLGAPIDAARIADTVERLADVWESDEAQAGIAAFLERREMPWTP